MHVLHVTLTLILFIYFFWGGGTQYEGPNAGDQALSQQSHHARWRKTKMSIVTASELAWGGWWDKKKTAVAPRGSLIHVILI